MVLLPGAYTYIGIDETCLSIGHGGLIVTAAITNNHSLASSRGYRSLEKSKDILRKAQALSITGGLDPKKIPPFPPLDEMHSCGLDNFAWMRARYGGRFSRQEIEHASIAHLVSNLNIKAKNTILLIDSFHGRTHETVDIICNYLNRSGIKLPKNQVECHGEGDRSIPIINYADILAFQIGVSINLRYRIHTKNALDFEVMPHQIPYDEHRIASSITNENRNYLDTIYNPKSKQK